MTPAAPELSKLPYAQQRMLLIHSLPYSLICSRATEIRRGICANSCLFCTRGLRGSTLILDTLPAAPTSIYCHTTSRFCKSISALAEGSSLSQCRLDETQDCKSVQVRGQRVKILLPVETDEPPLVGTHDEYPARKRLACLTCVWLRAFKQ